MPHTTWHLPPTAFCTHASETEPCAYRQTIDFLQALSAGAGRAAPVLPSPCRLRLLAAAGRRCTWLARADRQVCAFAWPAGGSSTYPTAHAPCAHLCRTPAYWHAHASRGGFLCCTMRRAAGFSRPSPCTLFSCKLPTGFVSSSCALIRLRCLQAVAAALPIAGTPTTTRGCCSRRFPTPHCAPLPPLATSRLPSRAYTTGPARGSPASHRQDIGIATPQRGRCHARRCEQKYREQTRKKRDAYAWRAVFAVCSIMVDCIPITQNMCCICGDRISIARSAALLRSNALYAHFMARWAYLPPWRCIMLRCRLACTARTRGYYRLPARVGHAPDRTRIMASGATPLDARYELRMAFPGGVLLLFCCAWQTRRQISGAWFAVSVRWRLAVRRCLPPPGACLPRRAPPYHHPYFPHLTASAAACGMRLARWQLWAELISTTLPRAAHAPARSMARAACVNLLRALWFLYLLLYRPLRRVPADIASTPSLFFPLCGRAIWQLARRTTPLQLHCAPPAAPDLLQHHITTHGALAGLAQPSAYERTYDIYAGRWRG